MGDNSATLRTVTFLQRAHLFKKERESIIEALASPDSDISKELIQCMEDAMKGEIEDRVAMGQYIFAIISESKKIKKLMIHVCGKDIISDLLCE